MKGFQENLKIFFWFKNGWKRLNLKFFGFNVFFYIWQPWDFCLFSSDFHKMSIANHLLTKWKWMLWLVPDLWKTSWNPFIWVLKHHAVGRPDVLKYYILRGFVSYTTFSYVSKKTVNNKLLRKITRQKWCLNLKREQLRFHRKWSPNFLIFLPFSSQISVVTDNVCLF